MKILRWADFEELPELNDSLVKRFRYIKGNQALRIEVDQTGLHYNIRCFKLGKGVKNLREEKNMIVGGIEALKEVNRMYEEFVRYRYRNGREK